MQRGELFRDRLLIAAGQDKKRGNARLAQPAKHLDAAGKEVVVYCQESRNATATQEPRRPELEQGAPAEIQPRVSPAPVPATSTPLTAPLLAVPAEGAKERHYRIHYGATGFGYDTIFGDYLPGAEEIVVEDPYIRALGKQVFQCSEARRPGF